MKGEFMKNWQIFGIFTFLIIGFLVISGCTQDNYKYCIDNYPGTTYDPATKLCEKMVPQPHNPTTTLNPRDCIIDESQTGQLEILDIQYDFKGSDRSKRLVGKAKNVGTNTISGTISYTDYIAKDSPKLERTDKIFKTSTVYKFCNIEPNQEFEFILEDIELPNIQYQPKGCCLGSLDAGQKIVTTGEGPRW
jgi:hypothetical protein